MIFHKKTQAELDTEFLGAVYAHSFDKAHELLAKGADIFAKDAEDNTAFHKLAEHRRYYLDDNQSTDAFVCFLLKQGLDINAPNQKGQSCLHLSTGRDMTRILLNRGADSSVVDQSGRTPLHYMPGGYERAQVLVESGAKVYARDNAGRTPLHAAASAGEEYVAESILLKYQPSLIAMQDNEGKYPHDVAAEGLIGHHDLARKLRGIFDAYHPPKAQTNEKIKPAVPAMDDEWTLLKPAKVEHTEETSRYRLTEIFNFSARTYIQITHNLETKTDVPVTKSFDEFSDKTLLEEAYRELKRLGGQADEASIYGAVLPKPKSQSLAAH